MESGFTFVHCKKDWSWIVADQNIYQPQNDAYFGYL